MSALSAPQQAELEKPVTRTGYFVELQFNTGTVRFATFNRNYDWGGFTWSGMGQMLRIGQVDQAEGTDPRALNMSLATQASLLALAVGPVEEYRGRPALLYMAPLTESYQIIGTPVLAWRGIMDTAAIGVNGEQGAVEIKCETAAYALKRHPITRVNAAQHKMRYPGELGLDYLNDLLAKPQRWLSKRFMSQ